MKVDINKLIEIKKDILNLLKIINEYKIQLSKTVEVKENNLNNNSDYSEGIEDLLNTNISITDAKKGEKMSPEGYYKRYGHYRKDDIPTIKNSKVEVINKNGNNISNTKPKELNKKDMNNINLLSGLLQSMLILDNSNASNKEQMYKIFLGQAKAEVGDTDNIIAKVILNKMSDVVNGKDYKSKVEAVKSNMDGIENPLIKQTAFYIVNETPVIDMLKMEYEGGELANERDLHKLKDYIYNNLEDGAKSIFGFSSISKNIRYGKEEDGEIIDLINKIGVKDTTFRGEGYGPEFIENIKVGQSYNDISKLKPDYDSNNEINSSNISESISVAIDFASGDTPVVNVFLDSTYIRTRNLSFYGKNELEGFIDKRKQILQDIYKDSYGRLYLIYKGEQ